ncbi:hypothetical protein COL922a_013911, partial [Colletotrichum nupharicola]
VPPRCSIFGGYARGSETPSMSLADDGQDRETRRPMWIIPDNANSAPVWSGLCKNSFGTNGSRPMG